MIVEEFRDVKGFEGLYEVSNLGRVRSLRNNHGQPRILVLKRRLDGDGYEQVTLYKNGKYKNCKVHRLVATAFIPNPDGLPEVNHIDECKTNNIVTNLEWCTRKYNMNYGTITKRITEKNSKRVYQYTKSGVFVRSYPSRMEAERQTGIDHSNICACCNNRPRYKSAGGYRWSFNPPSPSTARTLF